jgi:ATP-dependent DNA helicase RecG
MTVRASSRRTASAPATPPPTGAALLDTPLGQSGLKAAATLRNAGRRLGFYTVRDLLFHLPRAYEDLRVMHQLGELSWIPDGTVVSARAHVTNLRVEPTFRRRVQRTIAALSDDTGTAQATWFGRRFIEQRLHSGDEIIVSGKVKRFGSRITFDNPEFQQVDRGEVLHAGRIVPIYRLTAGLTAARLRLAIREALDRIGKEYPEYLPDRVRDQEQLLPIGTALEEAHYPSEPENAEAAKRRLAFDELLALQVGMVERRRQRGRSVGRAIDVADAVDNSIRDALEVSLQRKLGQPVKLTDDQAGAIRDIRGDLSRSTPMLRLLQGDVGSGKTAVAAWALAAAAQNGFQAALLAPTDLLARQHLETIADLLNDVGVDVVLLAGSLPAESKRHVHEQLANGTTSVVIGTHALIQEAVLFASLGLVVIDEQHRFGVEQRGRLEAKAGGHAPHVLLMTATPIPRTLGQVVYADLDVSNLRTPPAGRQAVATHVRPPSELERLWKLVQTEAEDGHATFVVVPAIEESDDEGIVAAKSEFERLQALLPKLNVGLVHGQMKAIDRDRELGRLRDGELDVLVGTTVLEVGVDVPRATLMIVEAADRFGLAQLHQLRGRVGRGTAKSYCALVSDVGGTAQFWEDLRLGRREPETTEQARLVAVARTTDGFELAEKDFELRREGNVLGLVQSGLPRLRVASLQDPSHRELATRTRAQAEQLLDEHGQLKPDLEGFRAELNDGWLKRVFQGEAGSAS